MIYLKRNPDGSQSIDHDRWAQEDLAELRDEWRMRHVEGNTTSQYQKMREQGVFYLESGFE